jgi:hypothetical protein
MHDGPGGLPRGPGSDLSGSFMLSSSCTRIPARAATSLPTTTDRFLRAGRAPRREKSPSAPQGSQSSTWRGASGELLCGSRRERAGTTHEG